MSAAASGRPVEEVTVAAALAGELGIADVSISAVALEGQAAVAEAQGNPQLAANLRRAAELTALPDAELLEIYEALRPGRSDAAELERLEADLRRREAPRCAALVAEAREAYGRRGLLR